MVKIGPNPDQFLLPIWTKSGPKCALNPDQYHKIRLLPDFFETSRSIPLCKTVGILGIGLDLQQGIGIGMDPQQSIVISLLVEHYYSYIFPCFTKSAP